MFDVKSFTNLIQTPDQRVSGAMMRMRSNGLEVVRKIFGIKRSDTSSSSIDRVKYEMRRDKCVSLRVEKLIKTLSNRHT